MRVAFIAPFCDGTGYSNASQNIILALDHVGVDVIPIWITYSNNPKQIHPKIKELQKKSADNIDVVIQCGLPWDFSYKSGVKNIGLFFYETTHFRGSGWANSCNLMDELWLTTEEQIRACNNSGVTTPTYEINVPVDPEKFDKIYPKINFDSFNHCYKFYTISEISYRKNILGLIASYYAAFTVNDNVCLIIRGFVDGKTAEETEMHLESILSIFKKDCRHPGFPPVIFISDHLSNDQLNGLHQSCNCFVTVSRGEGWNLPSLDAACFGNTVIVPGWNGTKKIFSDTNQLVINNVLEKNVVGTQQTVPKLYNLDETWFEPSVSDASKFMKECYKKKLKIDDYNVLLQRFSFSTVGEQLKNRLLKITP